MMDGWKYFDLSVDTRKARITPVEEVFEPSMITPNALWSTNSLGRSTAAFIYRFDQPPVEIKRRADERDSILRTETTREDNDYFDLFVHAEMEEGYLLHDIKCGNPVIVETPIAFIDDFRASVRVIAPDKILDYANSSIGESSGVCIEKVGYCQPMENDPLRMLTDRQEEILREAIKEGYYSIPRETSLKALGESFGIEPQTIGEHLRKIESKIIKRVRVGREKALIASCSYGTMKNARG